MDAAAERKRPDPFPGDIEFVGPVEYRRVAVGRGEQGDDLGALATGIPANSMSVRAPRPVSCTELS